VEESTGYLESGRENVKFYLLLQRDGGSEIAKLRAERAVTNNPSHRASAQAVALTRWPETKKIDQLRWGPVHET
jgi:hypothetical protein